MTSARWPRPARTVEDRMAHFASWFSTIDGTITGESALEILLGEGAVDAFAWSRFVEALFADEPQARHFVDHTRLTRAGPPERRVVSVRQWLGQVNEDLRHGSPALAALLAGEPAEALNATVTIQWASEAAHLVPHRKKDDDFWPGLRARLAAIPAYDAEARRTAEVLAFVFDEAWVIQTTWVRVEQRSLFLAILEAAAPADVHVAVAPVGGGPTVAVTVMASYRAAATAVHTLLPPHSGTWRTVTKGDKAQALAESQAGDLVRAPGLAPPPRLSAEELVMVDWVLTAR